MAPTIELQVSTQTKCLLPSYWSLLMEYTLGAPCLPVAHPNRARSIPCASQFSTWSTSVGYSRDETAFKKLLRAFFFCNFGIDWTSLEEQHAAASLHRRLYLEDVHRRIIFAVEFQTSMSPIYLPGVPLLDVILGNSNLKNPLAFHMTEVRTSYFSLVVGMDEWGYPLDTAHFPVVCPVGSYMQTWTLAHTAAWVVVNHLQRFGQLHVEDLTDPAQLKYALAQLGDHRLLGIQRAAAFDNDTTTAFRICYEVL